MSVINTTEFAKAVIAKLKERGMKPIDLEHKSKRKITRQNLSRYLNNKPHPDSRALPKPTEKFCHLLSVYLDWNEDEIRDLAGFAPKHKNLPDFLYTINWSRFSDHDREIIEKFIRFWGNEILHKDALVIDSIKPAKTIFVESLSKNGGEKYKPEDHSHHHPKEEKVVATIINLEDLFGKQEEEDRDDIHRTG